MEAQSITLDANKGALEAPHLLRLPIELRYRIYDLFLEDKRCPYRLPYTDRISRSTIIFEIPILHICQQLRYEGIKHFYSRLWWVVDDSKDGALSRWVRIVDPYALQQMKGVRLSGTYHEFPDQSRNPDPIIEIPFKGGSVKAIMLGEGMLGDFGLERHQRRVALARRFSTAMYEDMGKIKRYLRELLSKFHELGQEMDE